MADSQKDIEDLISTIFQAVRFFRRREVRQGKDILSQVRFEALAFVADEKRPTMKDLAKYFHITAPSATSLVEHLVKAKQLARGPDAKDRRQVRLALTAKGRRDLERSMAAKRKQWRVLLKKLSRKEQVQFANTFKKLSRG